MAAANIALGVGWGTVATVSVLAGSTDQRGRCTVTASTSGVAQATATVTLTFADGAYGSAPFAEWRLVANTNGITEAQPMSQTQTTTAIACTHSVLPVDTKTYTFSWCVIA